MGETFRFKMELTSQLQVWHYKISKQSHTENTVLNLSIPVPYLFTILVFKI